MQQSEMIELCKKHSLYAWSANDQVNPLPVDRAEGIYIYTPDGRQIIDFNSQLMSVNIGHGNQHVINAVHEQMQKLQFSYPGTATEIRARLSKRLADIIPGNINTFFYTLGGAEANENAIKMVRQYTGRHKIISRYRSYHGATHACMALTGDPRRIPTEPLPPGFLKVFDPSPYQYSFGAHDEEIVENNLCYLEEMIQYEGPETIAAMWVETVTGTNGILIPPKGYLKKLHALLQKYGILLVCDEVMAGFGRTGKLMAYEHFDIVPDIITFAKGLTSSYLPLGAVGLSDKIADYFRTNVFSGGLTYNSHPVALAAADANIDVLLDDKLIENAASLESNMLAHMKDLKSTHPSVRSFRAIGLFGMIDIQRNSRGELLADYNQNHPAMAAFNKALLDKGLFTFTRWSHIMCNPPLCITAEQLAEAFDIIDTCLPILDEVVKD